ncbi:MAG: type I restriction endonuclease subunit S [Nitrosomonas sp.]|nr:MAG: type I restriction endonuclease subunit S [Nitrosomonas sp.]
MSRLPLSWVWARVGELVDLGPKNQCDDETEAGFVPLQYLGVGYRTRHTFEVRPWSSIKKGYTHFADGDVLLARITPSFENGKAGIVRNLPNGMGAGSTEYFVCRPIPGAVLPEYLLAHFKMPQFLRDGEQMMSGAVGQQRVPKQYVLNSQLPLAPFNEQKRIADKLDSILARVDACRERLDRIPVILKRFRQAVLAAATSGKLIEEWRGGDSSNWVNERAANVCTKVQSGGTPKEGFTFNGIPFLKVYNIVDQKISFENKPQYITSEIHQGSMSKSQVQPGDVLMNIVGPPLGKVAIVPDTHLTWNINQAITLFRPSNRISTGWIYCILCDGKNIAEIIHETRGSAGQTNISLSQCRDFIFPIPPIEEQTEIVRRVEELFAYADRIEARYQAARAQVDKLTPAILAKAFRGELVPQDPNDEPASVLLERIRSSRAEHAVTPKSKHSRTITSRKTPDIE